MMEEKIFQWENNQNPENKEQLMEIEEAEIENVPGIFSVLNENLLPMELLDKEKGGLYLKNTGKKN